MIDRIFGKHSAKARIALGQVSILVCLVLLAFLTGFLPNSNDLKRQERLRIAETVAINASMLITQADLRRLENTLIVLKQRNTDLVSVGVRRNGRLVVVIDDHGAFWQSPTETGSTDQYLSVPLYAAEAVWGQVEFVFTPISGSGLLGFLNNRVFLFISLLSMVCFLIYFVYLGKMLKHLDPSQAIPGRVRSALDTMAEGLVVIDRKQNIVLANTAFASIVDQDPDRLMGVSVRSLPWVDEAGELCTGALPWDTSLELGKIDTNLILRMQFADSVRKTFMVNCSPVLAAEGKVGGALISFDDVTLLEEKELELRKAMDEAENANRAKSDFLATMSHEIRTPMNAILGFTELLKRGRDKNQDDYFKHLSTISNSGTYLLNLINDILDLSKIESGQLEIELADCGTLDVTRQVLQFMQVKAQEKGLYLELDVESSIPQKIQTDQVRLRQILTNLIGNSIKFTDSGGITIRVRMNPNDDRLLQIGIEDTGIGMTQEQSARIFDPFVQADSSITRRFGGTGLGLSISKKFAKAMGGDIRVTSNPGVGSVFTVDLAIGDLSGVQWVSPENLALGAVDSLMPVQIPQWRFRPADILVVDDGAENRDLVRLVLEDEGLRVQTASNGVEALEQVALSNFAVILMDVQMPVLDGLTAVGRMRAQGIDQPVVALTAHAMKGIEERCLEAGYSHYMTKPIDIDGLLALMAELLQAEPVTEALADATQPHPVAGGVVAGNRAEPVRSRLAGQARFQPLIERFAVRYREQVAAMTSAVQGGDFDQLADLAHWLKGAGGSLGFDMLTEPALQMELQARSRNKAACETHLITLQALCERLDTSAPSTADVSTQTACEQAPASPVVCATSQVRNAADQRSRQKNQEADDAARPAGAFAEDACDDTREIEPLYSRLASRDPRFVPLIERFVSSLQEKLVEMERLRDQDDWHSLAELAHWMKGSGGSVGFDLLAQEAAELENDCRHKQTPEIDSRLRNISEISQRIIAGCPVERVT